MSAREVAEVIGRIDGAMWLPLISHWEIAETDGGWGAHGELAADGSVSAVMALTKLASEVGSELANKGQLYTVDFAHQEVPVRVWWLRPYPLWVTPESCATCPTKLAGTGVPFVRLGEPGDRSAPVICTGCRDRMHREFVASAVTGGAA